MKLRIHNSSVYEASAVAMAVRFRLAVIIGLFVTGQAARADIPEKYRQTVGRGLEYLARTQHKDGYWRSQDGVYPVAMTGLAGMALLSEGSTIGKGRYSGNIQQAVEWLMAQSQVGPRQGLIFSGNKTEESRYMFGHGYATHFLAWCYRDMEEGDKKTKLKNVLKQACAFIAKSQIANGGFYYTSPVDGERDEVSVAPVLMQALLACRHFEIDNEGISKVLQRCQSYLEKATSPNGGVVYSLTHKGDSPAVARLQERPALSAAVLACTMPHEMGGEFVKKWFKFCKQSKFDQVQSSEKPGSDEFTRFYFAQAVCNLGDDGWEKLYGATPEAERVTWSRYRENFFNPLIRIQLADGSWSLFVTGSKSLMKAPNAGPVYSTATYCLIMQLEQGRGFLASMKSK